MLWHSRLQNRVARSASPHWGSSGGLACLWCSLTLARLAHGSAGQRGWHRKPKIDKNRHTHLDVKSVHKFSRRRWRWRRILRRQTAVWGEGNRSVAPRQHPPVSGVLPPLVVPPQGRLFRHERRPRGSHRLGRDLRCGGINESRGGWRTNIRTRTISPPRRNYCVYSIRRLLPIFIVLFSEHGRDGRALWRWRGEKTKQVPTHTYVTNCFSRV